MRDLKSNAENVVESPFGASKAASGVDEKSRLELFEQLKAKRQTIAGRLSMRQPANKEPNFHPAPKSFVDEEDEVPSSGVIEKGGFSSKREDASWGKFGPGV